MKPSEKQSDRGILKAEAGKQNFSLARYEPVQPLAHLVEYYWVVRWDLRGQAPYRQVVLSYPNVHMVFEKEHNGTFAGVYGVPSKPYTRDLHENGVVIGVKFQPGGFYPFWKHPISNITGQILSVGDVFGEDGTALQKQMFALDDAEKGAQLVERFLLERLPEPDDNVALLNRIVQTVIDNREITKVEDVVSLLGINKRTLQRLFSRYVGVSPKWVIKRYRLQEAAERMEKGDVPDWSALSQHLGYYDQSHFIKDFKAMVGRSPLEYVKDAGLS
ncbi:DUF6597 domain-containing transcriptional factor [Paenibacillus allorhizosphaerae]|uniref:HTH araC/xylS-type domain-containing protein n=1 Tax=Paenibacillus allorhizosphaerae TaxID=2849866 RepID=A0ABM8VPN0_9BACL|nr:AraC family transcriptional regulator [Paenibacillus allorhizosphaerae]CAG7653044.1 hypothetical protein PAECIP111802_05382 [Paenibacillus allorhizosphaerae]